MIDLCDVIILVLLQFSAQVINGLVLKMLRTEKTELDDVSIATGMRGAILCLQVDS